MKKLGSFLKGILKGGVVDSTPISGIIEVVKGFDKKHLIKLLDTNGDGKVDGQDVVNLSWEQWGRLVGMVLVIALLAYLLGIDINKLV